MSASPNGPNLDENTTHAYGRIDYLDLKATVAQVLDRWPCAGLAVAVIRDGELAWFHGHGLADVAAKAPITEDTVFRIGSITNTFTAIVVMQLWERCSRTSTRRRRTTFAASGWSRCSRICGRRLCDTSYAYRRCRLLAAAVGPASAGPGFGRPSGAVRGAASCGAAATCPLRMSLGRSRRTATMGLLRSGKLLRTSGPAVG
jgi:hypothetical protein